MTTTIAPPALEPILAFANLDGCHCITSSLARIFHHAGHPLSEEMLLGLGAGMGFVYWRMKFAGQESVFVGGRSNLKNFSLDVGRRTGVVIREKQTSSSVKAETELLRSLSSNQPVMLGGDLIVGFDGQDVTNRQDLAALMNARRAGDTVTVTVYRGRRRMDFKVTLGDAKDQPQGPQT